MKTPREILLGRCKAVEPKLDEIRQDVVAGLNIKGDAGRAARAAQSIPLSVFLGFPRVVWRELIWSSRIIWAGLAAVWLLIVAANFSMRDHSHANTAKSVPSSEIIMAFHQQQQLLSELIGPDDPPVAEAKKSYSPRPASERWTELLMT